MLRVLLLLALPPSVWAKAVPTAEDGQPLPPDAKCVDTKGPQGTICSGNFKEPVGEDHNPLIAGSTGNDTGTCRDYCWHTPCKYLVGNLDYECNLCSASMKCNPTAADWRDGKVEDIGKLSTSCEDFCDKAPCDTLSGDPRVECGGCGDTSECRPGAEHFDDYAERHKPKVEL